MYVGVSHSVQTDRAAHQYMFNTNKKFAEKYYEMEEKLLGRICTNTGDLKENRVEKECNSQGC